jgi:IclR family acetate operon transcriptional repressor
MRESSQRVAVTRLRGEALEDLSDKLPPIRAVERVCDIFDLLQEAPGGLSLTAIATRTGLPKTSAYRYLLALEAHRYVERDERTNTIRLGLAFRPKPSHHLDQFVARSIPVLEELRDVTNETLNLGVIDGGRWVHAAVCESNQMMRLAARVGERAMLHSTGIGKVIAAQLSDVEVRSILESEGMPAITSRTITSIEGFLAELARVRRQGYAVDDRENQAEGRCIAVPVRGAPVPCGVSLSAPMQRLSKRRIPELRDLLQKAARSLAADRPARTD